MLAGMKMPEIGLEPVAGAFRVVSCLEAVPNGPAALIITPRPPDLLFNLSGILNKPIFLAMLRLPSRRFRRAVVRKERQNLCHTAGVIHNIGFTNAPQDVFEVLLPRMHSCLSHLCTAGASDFGVPRVMGYSYVYSSITSLPI